MYLTCNTCKIAPGRRCASNGMRYASPSRDTTTSVVVRCVYARALSHYLSLSLPRYERATNKSTYERQVDSQSVSQSVSQVDRAEEKTAVDLSLAGLGAAIFPPHDAATVRARSIRHSKQSVRYVRSSQDASDNGRSRWYRRSATTTISAALRRPTNETGRPGSQPISQDGRTHARMYAQDALPRAR